MKFHSTTARTRNNKLSGFFGFFMALIVSQGADIQRGAQVARDANCLECHRVGGTDGRLAKQMDAPDLDSMLLSQYTVPALASTLWNHTPVMRGAVAGTTIPHPKITETESENLFAYLYSLRFHQANGEAKAGERAFEKRGCAECHASTSAAGSAPTSAPAVSSWNTSPDPFVLTREMWNHAPVMRQAAARRARTWPRLSGQDLLDINEYARSTKRNSPSIRTEAPYWPDPRLGQALFQTACKQCHAGGMSLDRMLRNKTLMDIAAGMWNHSARMLNVQVVSSEEMGGVVAYAWELQYMGAPGVISRGREVFEKKHCVECHTATERRSLNFQRGSRVFTPFSLIALGWEHGTLMEAAMKQNKIRWPGLSPQDVADVVAYLNSQP